VQALQRADALVRRLTRYQRRFGSALKLVVRGIVSNGISHLGNFQAVDLAGIWLAEGSRWARVSERYAGILGHLAVSIPRLTYQLQALPCGDRAADRQEAADSSPFAPVISLLREALSQRPMGGLCSSLNLLRSVMSGKAPFPTGQV
jgi:hypothetical protein